MDKGWLHGHEVIREWGVTDLILMQWLLDGLPAYSPNSLKKVEKHIVNEEGVMSFCEWTTGTAFRAYSLEGLRIRLLNLVFKRSDIEAAAAGPSMRIDRAKVVRRGKYIRFARGKKIVNYLKQKGARICRSTIERSTGKDN